MPCLRCGELAAGYRIVSPDELRRAIEVASARIVDGTLEELSLEGGWSSPTKFAEVAAGGAWDDIVSYWFGCRACGQCFRLGAETYHGGGGSWEAVERPEPDPAD